MIQNGDLLYYQFNYSFIMQILRSSKGLSRVFAIDSLKGSKNSFSRLQLTGEFTSWLLVRKVSANEGKSTMAGYTLIRLSKVWRGPL